MKRVQIRVFSVPYFPVFSPNTGKYGPEKTPYLDTSRSECEYSNPSKNKNCEKKL